jgi:hypothetical protein
VADHAGHVAAASGDGHAEGFEDELGAHFFGHRVAEQAAGAEIEHRRQAQPALTGRDVGDVLNPRRVRRAGVEAAADQVRDHVPNRGRGTWSGIAGDGSGQPSRAGASGADPVLVDREAGAAQLVMHAWHPVIAVGRVEDLPPQLDQLGLDDLAFGRPGGLPGAPQS